MTEIDGISTDEWVQDNRKPSYSELLLQLDGFSGPIDILLNLARDQKVDLTQISILELARQYLAFIEQAHEMCIELVADYLVMAAWLTYLKSRLLLPQELVEENEISGPEMAEALAFQLRRLEAVQTAAKSLMQRAQLGQDIFVRGMAEGLPVEVSIQYDTSLMDLLNAYGTINRRKEHHEYKPLPFKLISLEQAMERLCLMLGKLPSRGKTSAWTTLENILPKNLKENLMSLSAKASTFTASLEMVKQGSLEIRQDGHFKPLYMRVQYKDV